MTRPTRRDVSRRLNRLDDGGGETPAEWFLSWYGERPEEWQRGEWDRTVRLARERDTTPFAVVWGRDLKRAHDALDDGDRRRQEDDTP